MRRESKDGKAVFVQVELAGELGQALATESVQSVQDLVKRTPAPQGVGVCDRSGRNSRGHGSERQPDRDTHHARHRGRDLPDVAPAVYRKVFIVLIILFTVLIELQVARGVVAFLGMHGLVGLTTYVVNLLVSVGIAAGTDYAIFLHRPISGGKTGRRGPGRRIFHRLQERCRRSFWRPVSRSREPLPA